MTRSRRSLAVVLVATLGLGWSAALAVDAGAEPVVITGAVFEWSVNDESNTGAFNGQCNFMSGGISDGYAATYRSGDGDATVVKRTATGTYAPVSDYSTRCKDANGTTSGRPRPPNSASNSVCAAASSIAADAAHSAFHARAIGTASADGASSSTGQSPDIASVCSSAASGAAWNRREISA